MKNKVRRECEKNEAKIFLKELEDSIVEENIMRFELLLKYGSSRGFLHENAWFNALISQNNFKMILKTIILIGTDIKNFNGATLLHLAASKTNLDAAKLLIKFGADINEKDNYGMTALHYVFSKLSFHDKISSELSNDIYKITCLLLENGADAKIRAQTSIGQTPLYYAGYYNLASTAEFLIKSGAEVNTKDADGETPLHRAAISNSVETARIIILNGGEINAIDNAGQTPLHFSVKNGCVEMVELLLNHGCIRDIKNNDGMKAADMIKLNGSHSKAFRINELFKASKAGYEKTAESYYKSLNSGKIITISRPATLF